MIAISCTTLSTVIHPITYRPARNRISSGSSVSIWAPIVMLWSFFCAASTGKRPLKCDRHLHCSRNGIRWTAAMRLPCSVRISRSQLCESTRLPVCKCHRTMNCCCIYCSWSRRSSMRICSSLRWAPIFLFCYLYSISAAQTLFFELCLHFVI